MMRINSFEVEDWEEEYLKKRLNGHLLKFSREKLSLDNVQQTKDSDAVSVFIYSKIDDQILQEIPKLKLITTRSTGFDHIDEDAARKEGSQSAMFLRMEKTRLLNILLHLFFPCQETPAKHALDALNMTPQ
jgi:D-lactate dehydrogenase